MKTITRIASFSVLTGAFAALPLQATAYGEVDPSFTTTVIEGFTCRNSPTLLSDKSMLVHLLDQRTTSSSPGFRHGVAKVKADGTLDPTFGTNGVTAFQVPNGAANLLPLGDGRVLALGTAATRFMADGSVDQSYGHAAGTSPDFFQPSSLIAGAMRIAAAALLPDETLVVVSEPTYGGYLGFWEAWQPPGQYLYGVQIAWMTPDGKLALQYGNGGRAVLRLEQYETLYAWSLVADGTFEVATYRDSPNRTPLPTVRRASAPDLAVGIVTPIPLTGGVMPTAGIAGWVANNVKVDAFGGVMIASGYGDINAFGPDPVSSISLTRFLPDGSLDTNFGNGGTTTTTTIGQEVRVTSAESPAALWAVPGGGWTVLVDASTATGYGYGRSTTSSKRVVRFTAAGQVDASFARDSRMIPERVTQTDDGKLLQAASSFFDKSCTVKRLATDAPRVEGTLVEYYAPDTGHYFITLEGLEVGILDNHPEMGWKRTGRTFGAWAAVTVPGAPRVCRFYGDLAAGPNSHFYIPEGSGCDFMRRLEAQASLGTLAWRLEGLTFSAAEAHGGQCPKTLFPVYRFYNRGYEHGRDSNHRYSVDPSISAEMTAKGWVAEGIAFCVPPVSNRSGVRAS